VRSAQPLDGHLPQRVRPRPARRSDKLGYPKDFTIYDTDDSRIVIKGIVKEMQLDDKLYKPNQVHGRISIAKNNLIGPHEYLANAELMAQDAANLRPLLGEIYKAYAMKCFRAGRHGLRRPALQHGLALPRPSGGHAEVPAALPVHPGGRVPGHEPGAVQHREDVAARHENLTVVGDDSQSIYAFRGANIQNILNFRSDYPDHKLFKLEQNYRSTKTIVGAANSLIDKNKDQIRKTIWTENDEGPPIKVHRTLSDNEEGTYVAHNIFETKMQEQVPNKGFAILYRTNAQSRAMEEALRKLNIPYRIYGGLSFYQRKEIKDLLAYYRLVCNPRDEEALKRIINYPTRGIGQTTIEKLMVLAGERRMPIWEMLTEHSDWLGFHGGTQKRWRTS
jgi:DNA helicase-2/ATP-dependent DNA helicase PcrA